MAYNSDSAADRLAAVREAIGSCLTSQQYSLRGRMQQMARLRDLREMEKELMLEAGQQANDGPISLGMQVPAS